MAIDFSVLLTLLSQLKDTDLAGRIRTALERVYEKKIDAEAAAMLGTQPHERTGERTTYRKPVETGGSDNSSG